MGRSKIVDEQEAVRWFAEGRTYAWMVEQYLAKYAVETSPSMWGQLRHRKGLERRIVRDDNLIPWAVKLEHRWAYPVAMLRAEGKRRAGKPLKPIEAQKLKAFMDGLVEQNLVVHYEPETDEGFFLVPRLSSDDDVIRRPAKGFTQRHARD